MTRKGRFGFLARPAFHLAMVLVWTALLIPTLVWWKDSILWIGLMSDYALIVSHWSAYQGARAEHRAGEALWQQGPEVQDGTGSGPLALR